MDSEPSSPDLLTQAKGLIATGLSAMQNRGELFLLELEEEKTNLIELLLWAAIAGVMGLLFLVLFTFLIILLFPPDLRVFAVAGFCVLYLLVGLLAFFNLRSHIKQSPPPFSGTINEIKKDNACLDSFQ